jgi:hypothetical protein
MQYVRVRDCKRGIDARVVAFAPEISFNRLVRRASSPEADFPGLISSTKTTERFLESGMSVGL